jgi:light-regulated signal transduction histidine kinase (bacteriophytochrome)
VIRYEKIGIETVFEEYQKVMTDESHYRTVVSNLDGYDLKFSSHRIWTFYEMDIECANCGVLGDFFAVEKNHEGKRDHISTCMLEHPMVRFC